MIPTYHMMIFGSVILKRDITMLIIEFLDSSGKVLHKTEPMSVSRPEAEVIANYIKRENTNLTECKINYTYITN